MIKRTKDDKWQIIINGDKIGKPCGTYEQAVKKETDVLLSITTIDGFK